MNIDVKWSTPIAFLLLWVTSLANAERILIVAPAPSYSHQIVFHGLTESLLKRGHSVVFVTALPLKNSTVARYREIDVSRMYEVVKKSRMARMTADFTKGTKQEIDEIIYQLIDSMVEELYRLPEIQKICAPDSKEKFDAVIIEELYGFGIHAIFHALNAPMIGLISMDLHFHHNFLFGSPILPSHPSAWELSHRIGPEVTFWNRVENFVLAMYTLYHWYNFQMGRHERLVRDFLKRDIPPLDEIAKNTSLLLVNHELAFAHPRPVTQNIVFFSGLHILDKPPPLPKDMEKFLDRAKDGFIYMSLGCNVKSELVSPGVTKAIHRTFTKLPVRVLWKYDMDDVPNTDKIMTRKWIPQQTVLAHPNIKLFIFQGGQQSTEETVHYGVPVLGIPVMFEQMYRAEKLASLGVGRMLDIRKTDEKIFHEAIMDVLYNKSYKDNMMELRSVTRDKPYSHKERVAWWVEYVIRNKGAPHLRYSGADDPWYQRYDMDVIACLAIILFLLAVTFVIVPAVTLRYVYKRRETIAGFLKNARKTQQREKTE